MNNCNAIVNLKQFQPNLYYIYIAPVTIEIYLLGAGRVERQRKIREVGGTEGKGREEEKREKWTI